MWIIYGGPHLTCEILLLMFNVHEQRLCSNIIICISIGVSIGIDLKYQYIDISVSVNKLHISPSLLGESSICFR